MIPLLSALLEEEKGGKKMSASHIGVTLCISAAMLSLRGGALSGLACCSDDPNTFCAHFLQSPWLNVNLRCRQPPCEDQLCWTHVMYRNLYRIQYGSPIGPSPLFFFLHHMDVWLYSSRHQMSVHWLGHPNQAAEHIQDDSAQAINSFSPLG